MGDQEDLELVEVVGGLERVNTKLPISKNFKISSSKSSLSVCIYCQ